MTCMHYEGIYTPLTPPQKIDFYYLGSTTLLCGAVGFVCHVNYPFTLLKVQTITLSFKEYADTNLNHSDN